MTWTLSGNLRGPAGGPGASYVHVQNIAAATWTIPHGFGRIPHGVLVLIGGEPAYTETHLDATNVVLTFPAPITGEAHII